MTQTAYTDTNSIFRNNQALRGGVVRCDGCDATFTGSRFENNMAYEGGVFYMSQGISYNAKIELNTVTSFRSYSYMDGGFM